MEFSPHCTNIDPKRFGWSSGQVHIARQLGKSEVPPQDRPSGDFHSVSRFGKINTHYCSRNLQLIQKSKHYYNKFNTPVHFKMWPLGLRCNIPAPILEQPHNPPILSSNNGTSSIAQHGVRWQGCLSLCIENAISHFDILGLKNFNSDIQSWPTLKKHTCKAYCLSFH